MTSRLSLPLLCLTISIGALPKMMAQDTTATDIIVAPAIPIDYSGFLNLSEELQTYREARRIDISTFAAMLEEEDVLLLDSRSAAAYQAVHVKGATHLNFSDFTEEKLASIIPDKNTRILIYCNNNFTNGGPFLVLKAPPLALNIPTFINLYGYGYENIYELKGTYTPEEVEQHLGLERSSALRLPGSSEKERQ